MGQFETLEKMWQTQFKKNTINGWSKSPEMVGLLLALFKICGSAWAPDGMPIALASCPCISLRIRFSVWWWIYSKNDQLSRETDDESVVFKG